MAFRVLFLASTMGSLAEATGVAAVDTALVFGAPLFSDDFIGSHVFSDLYAYLVASGPAVLYGLVLLQPFPVQP